MTGICGHIPGVTCSNCHPLTPEKRAELREQSSRTPWGAWVDIRPEDLLALLDAAHERDRLASHAERMAAALALVLHDAHPIFGSTAKWHGGIGGQAITSHCSITQGAPPGDEWADYDMPSKPLREFLAEHPFDLEAAKTEMKQELLRDLDGSASEGDPTARPETTVRETRKP